MYTIVLKIEPPGTDPKSVHLIDGVLGRYCRITKNENEPLGTTSVIIHVYLGVYYVTKLIKSCGYICIRQVMGEVVDK